MFWFWTFVSVKFILCKVIKPVLYFPPKNEWTIIYIAFIYKIKINLFQCIIFSQLRNEGYTVVHLNPLNQYFFQMKTGLSQIDSKLNDCMIYWSFKKGRKKQLNFLPKQEDIICMYLFTLLVICIVWHSLMMTMPI